MHITSRSQNNTSQQLIDEFLSNGGKVTVCTSGATTEGLEYRHGFQRKKKPTAATPSSDDTDEN
jgi:hypothetical protein